MQSPDFVVKAIFGNVGAIVFLWFVAAQVAHLYCLEMQHLTCNMSCRHSFH